MLPALRADDAIRTANVVAMGTGSVSEDDARTIRRDWTSAVEAVRGRPPVRKATPHDLSQIGIKTVAVPKVS